MYYEQLALSDPEFQSTPSARRATAPRAALKRIPNISIHALREEGDAASRQTTTRLSVFQSTPSARRATVFDFRFFEIALFQSAPSARRATCTP